MPVTSTIEAYENAGSLDMSRGTYSITNPDTQGRIPTGLSRVVKFEMTPAVSGAPATVIPTIDLSGIPSPGRVDDGSGRVPVITGIDSRGYWEAKGYF